MNGTDFRMFYEQFAIYKIAEKLGIKASEIQHISKENPTATFDLKYNNFKFDVKYSHPVVTKKKGKMRYWDFNLRKVINGKRVGNYKEYCDFYFCIGMQNGIPKKIFMIPIKEAPTSHIRISVMGDSRYNQFLI